MDQLVNLSIPKTHTRRTTSFLKKFYTVMQKQIYELKIVIGNSFVYFLFKRYKELHIFHKTIKNILKKKYAFPKFPSRVLNPMNPEVIKKRKIRLEKWLQHALTLESLDALLQEFLEIPTGYLSESPIERMNEDEYLIKEFHNKIHSSPHSKTNIIDEFEKHFFLRRRNLSEYFIHLLVSTLAPLCSDEFIGSKALYFLYELCSPANFFYFEISIKELAKIDTEVLSQMKLNDYFLKRRFADGQIQAFHILNELKAFFPVECLVEILNGDLEAFDVFMNWDGKNCMLEAKHNYILPVTDWRSLSVYENGLSLSYRFLGKDLHILAKFQIISEVYKLADLIITPNKRKLWDLNLHEMEKLDNNGSLCFRLIYSHKKTFYEFHNSVSIDSTESKTNILFESKTFPINLKGELGNLNIRYKLKKINKNDSLSPRKDHMARLSSSGNDSYFQYLEKQRSLIKVTWRISLCESSRNLLISDIVGETDLIYQSFKKFLSLAENKLLEPDDSKNSISQACDRKRLKNRMVLKKHSSVEGLDFE